MAFTDNPDYPDMCIDGTSNFRGKEISVRAFKVFIFPCDKKVSE